MIRLTWWDASQDPREYIRAVPDDYAPGLLNDVLGYLVGETESFYVLADTYEADIVTPESLRRYQCIRNIPKALVSRLLYLKEGGAPLKLEVKSFPEQERSMRREASSASRASYGSLKAPPEIASRLRSRKK